MNAYTPKITTTPGGRKAYVKPGLRKMGSVTRLTLKGGSQADAFSTYTP